MRRRQRNKSILYLKPPEAWGCRFSTVIVVGQQFMEMTCVLVYHTAESSAFLWLHAVASQSCKTALASSLLWWSWLLWCRHHLSGRMVQHQLCINALAANFPAGSRTWDQITISWGQWGADFGNKPGLPCGLWGGPSWSGSASPCLQSPQIPPGHICCTCLDPGEKKAKFWFRFCAVNCLSRR